VVRDCVIQHPPDYLIWGGALLSCVGTALGTGSAAYGDIQRCIDKARVDDGVLNVGVKEVTARYARCLDAAGTPSGAP
jgi:hypothetical protein